jgi:2-alkenal reductase
MEKRHAKRLGWLVAVAAAFFAGLFVHWLAPRAATQALVPRVVTARGALADTEQATIALFEMAAPSVVQVVSRTPVLGGFPGSEAAAIGAGSGFVWDGAGHIVTNNHVVEAQQIVVRLSSGETIPATVIGRAPRYDIAVLRLARRGNVRPLALGASRDLKVGQSVFAIGNPFGLDQSLTSGIVSALGLRLPTREGREIADVIQTDAAINPGNSGGPLLDSAGRVVGVNTAIISPTGAYAGVGFAVPIDTVARLVPDIIRRGRVATPGIGVLVADETLAARLGIEGLLVMRTQSGSPAARAGLRGTSPEGDQLGDIIVEANGRPVRRMADLTNEIEQLGVGRTINLVVRRDDRAVRIAVPIEDING